MHRIQGKCVITVLNRSDLVPGLKPGDLPPALGPVLEMSARQDNCIPKLRHRIRQVLGIIGFDLEKPICFTERQRHLLTEMQACSSPKQIQPIINAILNSALDPA